MLSSIKELAIGFLIIALILPFLAFSIRFASYALTDPDEMHYKEYDTYAHVGGAGGIINGRPVGDMEYVYSARGLLTHSEDGLYDVFVTVRSFDDFADFFADEVVWYIYSGVEDAKSAVQNILREIYNEIMDLNGD